jgi:fatty acid desaturase
VPSVASLPRFRARQNPPNKLNKPGGGGKLAAVARARTIAGYAIPGIIVFFFWMVVIILAIILLAAIVHWAGGGVLNLRLGHFELNVGFT